VPPAVVTGARCIFVHDHSTAIQAAAEAAGGGEVEFTRPHMLVTRTAGGGISWCIGVCASRMRFKLRGKGKIYHRVITGGVFLVTGAGKAGALTSLSRTRTHVNRARPSFVRRASVDAEVLDYAMHVQEAEDKQHDRDQADEREGDQDEEREPVER
jgi:hypothetical protein